MKGGKGEKRYAQEQGSFLSGKKAEEWASKAKWVRESESNQKEEGVESQGYGGRQVRER